MFARNLMLNRLLEDEDDDGIPDVIQRPFKAISSTFNYSLFSRDRQSIRGRKELIREIPIEVLPTKYQDSDDEGQEVMDENGEDIPVLKNGVFAGQHYDKIKSKCLATNQLFTDPMFPPCESSIFIKATTASDIEWKRASQMVAKPCFFVDGESRFDIIQGELGDCWLSAAVANLTMRPELFKKVVPHDQSFVKEDYAGIFHFRFWQFGQWIDIVVDDYLPTKNGQLFYMRSEDANEFWSALLEKAYAKLHGNYQSLIGGSTTDALVDFSGGCTEHFNLNEAKLNAGYIKKLLLKGLLKNSMIAASIDANGRQKEAKLANGLVRGHAFSVIHVLKVLRKNTNEAVFLVRLRNPWGNKFEWNGAWSDGSKEWATIRDKNNVRFQDDGEFFMSIQDFTECFDSLDICNLTPESIEYEDLDVVWQQSHHHGSWIRNESAGGCRNYLNSFATNPQFNFELMDANNDGWCTCVVALMQKGSRKGKVDCQNGCLTIGFCIYEIDKDEKLPLTKEYFSQHQSARVVTFINRREVVARFNFEYKSGKNYVVIPSTFEPNEEGDFLLRIFSEKKVK